MEFYLLKTHVKRRGTNRTVTKPLLKKLLFCLSVSKPAKVLSIDHREVAVETGVLLKNGNMLLAGYAESGLILKLNPKTKHIEKEEVGFGKELVFNFLATPTCCLTFGKYTTTVAFSSKIWTINLKIKVTYCKDQCTNHSRDLFCHKNKRVFMIDDSSRLVAFDLSDLVKTPTLCPPVREIMNSAYTFEKGLNSSLFVLATSGTISQISLDTCAVKSTWDLLSHFSTKVHFTTFYSGDGYYLVFGVNPIPLNQTTIYVYLISTRFTLKSEATIHVNSARFDDNYNLNPVHKVASVKVKDISLLLLSYYYEWVQVALVRKNRFWSISFHHFSGFKNSPLSGNTNKIICTGLRARREGALLSLVDGCNILWKAILSLQI